VEGVDGAADCEGAERAGAVKQRIFFGPDLAEAIRAETHEPLIDGLIDKGTFVLAFGEPKKGKTFVALSMAAAIASGEPWAGRKTGRGVSAYFAGEGGSGIKRRAATLAQDHSPSEMPLALIPGHFNLMAHKGVDQIISDIEDAAKIAGVDPAAVYFDTLSRGFAGQNENDSTAMGLFVQGVDRIREKTSATVVVLHHVTKSNNKDARGRSILRGAYDTALLIADNQIKVVEQRDLEAAPPISFRLKSATVGPDATGKMLKNRPR
jgi:RecA-family ATPase